MSMSMNEHIWQNVITGLKGGEMHIRNKATLEAEV